MHRCQFVITGLFAFLTASTCLTARTIMLDDPRPGVVSIWQHMGIEIRANGQAVSSLVSNTTATERSGSVNADTSRLVLSDWDIHFPSASEQVSIVIDSIPYTVRISTSEWNGGLVGAYTLPLSHLGNDVYQTSIPLDSQRFNTPSTYGTISIDTPSGSDAVAIELPFTSNGLVGGFTVNLNPTSHFYVIGFDSDRDVSFSSQFNGVHFEFTALTQIGVSLIPEPSGSLLLIISAFVTVPHLRRFKVANLDRYLIEKIRNNESH